MYTARMFFEKSGQARYISHLDLMRCFERAMRRADIPFWYTEGFNPRPFLTFASPLSLGFSGLREVVDIRITEDDFPLEDITRRVNASLPDGLRIIETALPVKKAKEVAASKYSIAISCTAIGTQELASALSEFLSADSIITTKLNKKKQRVETELKHMISSFDVNAEECFVKLDIILASGCTENCNPTLVLDAFFESIAQRLGGEEPQTFITRTEILDASLASFS